MKSHRAVFMCEDLENNLSIQQQELALNKLRFIH